MTGKPSFVARSARVLLGTLLVVALMALPAPPDAAARTASRSSAAAGDATVVAVIDYTFAPYHWDFLASKMPRSARFPLARAPHGWVPGFPNPARAFKSYTRFPISLEERNEMESIEALDAKDEKRWAKIKLTDGPRPHYYWIPDTKVIGAIDFAGTQIHGGPGAHGTGTTSVSVGNLHGTCPECLLVFLNISDQASGERAIEWAMRQPWIDAITNSYGFSITPVTRDRVYSGSDTKLQRRASERGQTIFFSAGNGQANAFLIPNTTLLSSQEGPDWIVTVGAVSPGAHASYTGHGKPADIASLGSSYPAAYDSPTVGGTGSGGFSGTSNSTPVIAGTYARALWSARRDLRGPSRLQRNGIIARGGRFDCGRVRPSCELGDRTLTANELRRRLFLGAVHTEAGLTPAGVGSLPPVGEEEFLSEGHGSYFGRETGKVADWLKEFERILAPLEGRARELKRPQGERDWMIVDSFCRQHLWGAWSSGYYSEGRSKLPGQDMNYPVRSALEQGCPHLEPAP